MLKQQLISFARRLLLFLLIIAVADRLLGVLLEKAYFRQPQGLDAQLTHVIRSTRAEVLVLGSSRGLNAVDPALIRTELGRTAYNAGMEGQSMLYHEAILRSVLQRYSPRMVLLCVDAGGFTQDRSHYDRLSRLLPYYREDPEIRKTVCLRSPWEPLKMLSAIYPYNSKLLDMLRAYAGKNQAEVGVDGFVALKRQFTGPARLMDFSAGRPLDTLLLQAYRNLIRECRQAGVELRVICPPYQVQVTAPDASLEAARRIAAEASVPYWDYFADPVYRAQPGWFADYRHFNAQGAQAFTRDLVVRLKQEAGQR